MLPVFDLSQYWYYLASSYINIRTWIHSLLNLSDWYVESTIFIRNWKIAPIRTEHNKCVYRYGWKFSYFWHFHARITTYRMIFRIFLFDCWIKLDIISTFRSNKSVYKNIKDWLEYIIKLNTVFLCLFFLSKYQNSPRLLDVTVPVKCIHQ